MIVEQIYTGCLAEAAYYIQSGNEAIIIDPLRETAPYIDKAKANGAVIKYVFLTHFHADFVSGHVDLAQKTGATIVYGPNAEAAYAFHKAKDGEVFKIGEIGMKLIHTPGHTMESSCYLLFDENGKEHAVFTGDTLFIGDVGRPDLAVKSDLSQQDLAGHLFESLRNKIMTLPDDITVYPAHGAGSACGKNMSSETFDTLGNQKNNNYALRADMGKTEFIEAVLTGLSLPPQYFPVNVMMNKSVNPSIDEVLKKGTQPINFARFKEMIDNQEALVLDTRFKTDFCNSHIPNSLFVGIDGGFAPWVGALISDAKQPIIIVADSGREEEVVTRLSRIGYDNAMGYLEGGFDSWKNANYPTERIETVSVNEMEKALSNGAVLVDVRKPGEWSAEHVEGVENMPLDTIFSEHHPLSENAMNYIHCASGFRSVIYCSIMKSRGIHNVVDVQGGFKAIQTETKLKTTTFVCPSTQA